MISVPNHRLPLNGSKSIAVWLVIFGIFSCAGPRKVVQKPASPPVKQQDKIRVYDPKTDTYVLQPRNAVVVDTIQWSVDPSPPLITDKNAKPAKSTIKSHYDISLMMPFNAAQSNLYAGQQDAKLNRFIQYYAGIRMAMDEIDSMRLPISLHSYDVGDNTSLLARLLAKPEMQKTDVIVGPYEREQIELAAAYGSDHEIMVVSPWVPAFNAAKENPFLIQIFPGLAAHADAIMKFIENEMAGKKVYVVARNLSGESNRIQLFNNNKNIQINELILKDQTPDLEFTDLNMLLNDLTGTIFILPYYSRSDETFVNSFMRKLHADKGTREAIVFGLPQWTSFTNLTSNYMESLSLHLSISSFVDVSNPAYQTFRSKFLKKFHTIPDLQAFQGYDLLKWISACLMREGNVGLIGESDPESYGLACGFDIRPVYTNKTASYSEMQVPSYYENNRIRILKYVNQDYILAK